MKNILYSILFVGLIYTSGLQADISNGLIAHYKFNNNLNDATPNGVNGTDDGGTLGYTNAVFNRGLLFDNYPDLVKFDTATFLQNKIDTTVAMWIRTTFSNKEAGILSANTGSTNEYLIFLHTDGTIEIEIDNINLSSSKKINDGFFHHLAITTSASRIAIYIDGELDQEADITMNPISYSSYVWLGNDQDSTNGGWSSGQQFFGVLDDLRIYHRTLSINDIEELYQSGAGNIIPPGSQYADIILDSYYSHANPDFSTFYGGDSDGGPKVVPVSYAADKDETTAVSLPTGSYITVGFSKYSIIDAPNQDDLFIVEGGAGGEDAKIYISSDFENFTYLGLAQDDVTTSFDLASIGYTQPVVAVKVIGQDNGGSWPGFDLFEVKGLPGSLIENSSQCSEIVEIYGKSPNTGKWILFSNPCDLPVGWETSKEKPSNTMCNNPVVIML